MKTIKFEKVARSLLVGLFALSMLVLPIKNFAGNMEASASASAIVAKAYSKIGANYVYGGAHSYSALQNPNQNAFDCSGFVSWVYYQAGHNIGVRTSSSLRSVGYRVGYNDLQPGDIVLFSGHAGIYIGNNQMIHAPNSRSKVRVQSLAGYYRRKFIQGRRVVGGGSAPVATAQVTTTNAQSAGYSAGNYQLRSTMRVRSGASTRYRTVGSLRRGSRVYVSRVVNGWGQISYRGRVRYISLAYANRV